MHPYNKMLYSTKHVDAYVPLKKIKSYNKWVLRCEYPLQHLPPYTPIIKRYVHLYLKKIKCSVSQLYKLNPIIVVDRDVTSVFDSSCNTTFFLDYVELGYRYIPEVSPD